MKSYIKSPDGQHISLQTLKEACMEAATSQPQEISSVEKLMMDDPKLRKPVIVNMGQRQQNLDKYLIKTQQDSTKEQSTTIEEDTIQPEKQTETQEQVQEGSSQEVQMEQADKITEPIEDEAQSEDEVLEQIKFHNTSNKTSKKVQKEPDQPHQKTKEQQKQDPLQHKAEKSHHKKQKEKDDANQPIDLTINKTPEPPKTSEHKERRDETAKERCNEHHKEHKNRKEQPSDPQLKRKSTSTTKEVNIKKSRSSPHTSQLQDQQPSSSPTDTINPNDSIKKPNVEVKSSPKQSKRNSSTNNRKLMGERMKNDASVSKPTTYLKLSKFHKQLMVTMNEDFKMVLYRHIHSLSSNQDQWQSLHITNTDEDGKEIFKCDKCAFETRKKCDIKRHINSAHLRIGDKKCTYTGCNFITRTSDTVVKHYVYEHSMDIIEKQKKKNV